MPRIVSMRDAASSSMLAKSMNRLATMGSQCSKNTDRARAPLSPTTTLSKKSR